MPTSRPVVARVLAVPTVLILPSTACGGGDEADTLETTSASSEPPTTESVDPVTLRLTFNGESCTHDGPTELTPGPVDLAFLNESDSLQRSTW